MVGSLGDVACFSYNGNKIITTGGGGMIVTDNEAWADKAKYLTTQAKDDPLEYVHNEIGYNYRLTNVLAAIGVAQMEKLDEYVAVKRRIAGFYSDRLGGVPGIRLMAEAPWAASTFWLYTVLVDRGEIRHGQPRFAAQARASPHSSPAAVAADPRQSGLRPRQPAKVPGGRTALRDRAEVFPVPRGSPMPN